MLMTFSRSKYIPIFWTSKGPSLVVAMGVAQVPGDCAGIWAASQFIFPEFSHCTECNFLSFMAK